MVLEVLLCTWLLWVVAHLVMLLLVRPNVPCCNGFRIFIPVWVYKRLTRDEHVAIFLHEWGHLHRRHVWKNFALVCIFRRASPQRRFIQELEADDCAAAFGYGFEMASALRKLSLNAYDNVRARRLELKGSRDVGDPYRAGGTTLEGEADE